MTPAKREQLDRLIDRVAAMLDGGVEPQIVLDMLVADEGARFRFYCGAYELRMAGIAGTSTHSRKLVLESWMRAALRRIAREAGR